MSDAGDRGRTLNLALRKATGNGTVEAGAGSKRWRNRHTPLSQSSEHDCCLKGKKTRDF